MVFILKDRLFPVKAAYEIFLGRIGKEDESVRKLSLMLAAVLVLTLGLAAGCQGREKVLNIFTWADFIPQFVIDDFEREFGVKVQYSTFDLNEDMLVELQAVNGGEYDLVLASDYIIDIAIREGLAGLLDKEKIPLFKDIDPDYQSQYYDENNLYTVPYAAGTPLIVYDPSAVSFAIEGYKDLWNEELRDSIVVMDDMRNVIGMVLKTLGYSFNTTDAGELERAREKLFELKPNIRVMDYDNPQNWMISGETTVGYMFTPQVYEVLAAKPDFVAVYPKEGKGYGIDSFFIPVNAPNPDNAHEFLNFILDGERSARISEQVLYNNCVSTARPFLQEYFDSDVLYIPPEILGETEFMMDVGDMTPVYEEIWAEYNNLY